MRAFTRIAAAFGMAMCFLLQTAARSQVVPAAAGKYCGVIWSNGVNAKAVTILAVAADGSFAGEYVFAPNRQPPVSGVLEMQGAMRRRDADFLWRDTYGTGLLTIRFSANFHSFAGKWGADGQVPRFKWNGKRCDGPNV